MNPQNRAVPFTAGGGDRKGLTGDWAFCDNNVTFIFAILQLKVSYSFVQQTPKQKAEETEARLVEAEGSGQLQRVQQIFRIPEVMSSIQYRISQDY